MRWHTGLYDGINSNHVIRSQPPGGEVTCESERRVQQKAMMNNETALLSQFFGIDRTPNKQVVVGVSALSIDECLLLPFALT
jgi:hypothetical protein